MTENNETFIEHQFNYTSAAGSIRPALRIVFPVFVTIYAIVGLVGVFGNICMVATLIRRQLCSDTTFVLLANIAIADLLKTSIALPLTLYRILIEAWNLGMFCCYLVAVIQSWPLYASVLTYLTITVERYRRITEPTCKRMNAAVVITVIWFTSGCASMPLILYVRYVDRSMSDIADIHKIYAESALLELQHCIVFHEYQFEDYIRGLFTALYVIPLITVVFLNWKISAILRKRSAARQSNSTQRQAFGAVSNQFTSASSGNVSKIQSGRVVSNVGAASGEVSRAGSMLQRGPSKASMGNDAAQRAGRRQSPPQEQRTFATPRSSDDRSLQQEITVTLDRELKAHRYISLMVLVFAACWCPLHLLHAYYVLSKQDEKDDSEIKIDVSYLMFFWLGFLSACINPLIFASWRLPQSTRNRLRGYFRFSLRGEAPLLANATLSVRPASSSQLPTQVSCV